MKLLDMTRKYGSATYGYPLEPYNVPDGFRGKPAYDYEKCIGCAACAVACPSNAINVKFDKKKDKLVWEFNCARCIFCGRCDEVCPTNAVMLSKEFEMSVKFNKEDLMERGELDVQRCDVCHKVFTTKKLIAYDLERLKKVGWSEETLAAKTSYIHTCQECKKNSVVEQMNKMFKKGKK